MRPSHTYRRDCDPSIHYSFRKTLFPSAPANGARQAASMLSRIAVALAAVAQATAANTKPHIVLIVSDVRPVLPVAAFSARVAT